MRNSGQRPSGVRCTLKSFYANHFGKTSQGTAMIMTLHFIKEWSAFVQSKDYGGLCIVSEKPLRSQQHEIQSDVKL